MTKKQIEKKAKEMANKYAALGFKSGLSRERYEAAMEMAEWMLTKIASRANSLLKE